LFEAGALSKGLSKNRVCPFLIDFPTSHLKPPLSQFNAASPTEDEMYKLIRAINSASKAPLSAVRLDQAFAKWWPGFLSSFEEILQKRPSKPVPKRPVEEVVVEVLEIVRSLQKQAQAVVVTPAMLDQLLSGLGDIGSPYRPNAAGGIKSLYGAGAAGTAGENVGAR
jgi:hypothetical protein